MNLMTSTTILRSPSPRNDRPAGRTEIPNALAAGASPFQSARRPAVRRVLFCWKVASSYPNDANAVMTDLICSPVVRSVGIGARVVAA